MCVIRSKMVGWGSSCLIFCIMLSLLAPMLFAIRSFARTQSGNTSGLLITPSDVVLLVGEDSAFSAIDETGRPVSNVEWSIKPSIAELHSDSEEIRIEAKTDRKST